jgi:hypothetical protein
MSRLLFDYLIDSVFFDHSRVLTDFRGLTDHELSAELESYRHYVLEHTEQISEEVTRPDEHIAAVFGPSVATSPGFDPVARLVQTAMYFDSAVLDDPLFRCTAPLPQHTNAIAVQHGYPPRSGIDRPAVVSAVQQLRRLQPFVGADLLKFAPLSRSHEPPLEIPLFFSQTRFAERVPSELLGWIHERARVHSLVRTETGWGYRQEAPVVPSRGIVVDFEDHPGLTAAYHLSRVRAQEDPSEPDVLQFESWLPDDPPEPEVFQAWVEQSINQTAGGIIAAVASELHNAASVNAMFITDSGFIAELLTRSLRRDQSIQEEIAALDLRFNLSFLENVSIEDLARMRNEEGEAFLTYRRFLAQELRQLRHLDDHSAVRRRLADLEHELQEIQIPQLNAAIRRIRTRFLIGAGIGAASFATLAPSGGLSLGPMLLGGAQALQGATDYRHTVMGHPAYFLWRLQRTSG